jgi:hypothetical protein
VLERFDPSPAGGQRTYDKSVRILSQTVYGYRSMSSSERAVAMA